MKFFKNNLKLLVAAVTLASVPYSVLGQSYATINMGKTTDQPVNTTTFSVAGGYIFTENLALELTYKDLGSYSEDALNDGNIIDIDNKGVGLYVIGNIPIADNTNLYGKVGMVAWDVKGSYLDQPLSFDGTDLGYGIGASFQINESTLLKLELDRLRFDLDDESTGVDNFSLGFTFLF